MTAGVGQKRRRSSSTENAKTGGTRGKLQVSKAFQRKVRAALDPELKEVTQFQSNVIAAGGDVTCLNLIGAGTQYNQRTGNHVRPVGIDICWALIAPSSLTYDVVTFWLIWDTQPDNATPAVAAILDQSQGADINLQFLNTGQNRNRFKVIMNERMVVSNANSTSVMTGNYTENVVGRRFASLAKFEDIEFNSTASSIPNSGALWLVRCSYDNTGVVATSSTLRVNTKFTFNDV